MDKSMIVLIATVILFLLLFILVPVRRNRTKKICGTLIMKMTEPALFKSILILVVAVLIIVLAKIKNFPILREIILDVCALFGEYIVLKDIALRGMSGVYTKGILADGAFIEYSEVTCLPVLQLPPEEQEDYDKSTLVITTKNKKSRITLMFNSEGDCSKATEGILAYRPDLKTW